MGTEDTQTVPLPVRIQKKVAGRVSQKRAATMKKEEQEEFCFKVLAEVLKKNPGPQRKVASEAAAAALALFGIDAAGW
jgi:hypothetical protein